MPTTTRHPSPRDRIDLVKGPAVEVALQAIEAAKRLPEPIRTTALDEPAEAFNRARRYAMGCQKGVLPCQDE